MSELPNLNLALNLNELRDTVTVASINSSASHVSKLEAG